jgi:hypothetical protein
MPVCVFVVGVAFGTERYASRDCCVPLDPWSYIVWMSPMPGEGLYCRFFLRAPPNTGSASAIQIRYTTTLPTALLTIGAGTRVRYAGVTMSNMLVVTVGVAIASYGEINFHPLGVALQLASLATESTRLTLVQILLQRKGLKMNPFTTMYYVRCPPVSYARMMHCCIRGHLTSLSLTAPFFVCAPPARGVTNGGISPAVSHQPSLPFFSRCALRASSSLWGNSQLSATSGPSDHRAEESKCYIKRMSSRDSGWASLGCGQLSVRGEVANRVTIKRCYQRQCGAVGVDSSTWCSWC